MNDAPRPPTQGWLTPLVLILVTLLLHAPTLGHALLHDDRALILDNPAVASARSEASGLVALFTDDALAPVRLDGPDTPDLSSQALYRPLTLLLWTSVLRAVDGVSTAAGALPAWPFHLLSLLAHAAVVALLWLVVARLFQRTWLATLAALLFALHPLPTAAVAHVAALGTLLSAAAVLGGLLCFRAATAVPGRLHAQAFAGLLALLFFGLLCHEQAVLIVPAVALADWLLPRRTAAGPGDQGSPDAPAGQPRAAVYAGLFVVLALAVLLRSLALGHLLPSVSAFSPIGNPLAAEPVAVRLLNGPALVALPLRLMLWPAHLSADYSFDALPVARSLLEPASLIGLAAVLALLVAGLSVRRRDPAASLGLLGFLGAALAGAGVLLPLGSIWSETRSYLPAAFGCLAVAAALDALARRGGLRNSRVRAFGGLLLLLLAGGLLAARTLMRERDFVSSLALYAAAERVVPRSARVHERLGAALSGEHRYSEAAAQYEAALAIAGDHVPAALGLADALAAQGRAQEALAACDRLVAQLEAASHAAGDAAPAEARRALQSHLRLALARRARARIGRGDLQGAAADLRVAVTLPGAGAEPEMRLARLFLQSGRPTLAVPILRDALLQEPDNPEALYELARADLAAGDEEAARRVLDKLQQTPRGQALALLLDAVRLYGEALEANDEARLEEALALFDRVRVLDPELSEPWLARGRRLFEQGQVEEALPDLAAAVERSPRSAPALLLLARAQNALGRPQEALATAQRLAVLDAGVGTLAAMAEAHLRLGQLEELANDCAQLDALGADPVEVVLVHASALHETDRLDEAMAVLALARRLPGYGGDPRLLRAQGEVLMDAGHAEEALAALDEQALREQSRPEGLRDGMLAFNRARALTLLHRGMEAAAALEQAEAATPAGAPLRALLLQRRAELFLSEEGPFFDPAEAAQSCAEALAASDGTDPVRDEALLRVSIAAALAAGDVSAALLAARDAAARFPDAPRWKAAATALQRAERGDRLGAVKLLRMPRDHALRRIAEQLQAVAPP